MLASAPVFFGFSPSFVINVKIVKYTGIVVTTIFGYGEAEQKERGLLVKFPVQPFLESNVDGMGYAPLIVGGFYSGVAGGDALSYAREQM